MIPDAPPPSLALWTRLPPRLPPRPLALPPPHRAARGLSRDVMTRRGPISCDVQDILNLKAGRVLELGGRHWASAFSWAAAGGMAEEAAVAVCVRVRPLNSR